jgi:hypothetical protein
MRPPVHYTEEIAREILERLAGGESLRSVCRDEHLPDEASVREWVVYDKHGFAAPYRKARDIGLDVMADELLDIADDGSNDYMARESEKGRKIILNKENAARSRLRLEARKWYLSKMAPKKYGEKLQTEVTNPDGSLTNLNETQLAAKLNAIHAAASERLKQKQLEEAGHDDAFDLV